MSTFIYRIDQTKIHYYVNLHQNLTNSFQIINNVISTKIQKITLKVKGQGQG